MVNKFVKQIALFNFLARDGTKSSTNCFSKSAL